MGNRKPHRLKTQLTLMAINANISISAKPVADIHQGPVAKATTIEAGYTDATDSLILNRLDY